RRDGARDDHHVGLAWRRPEHLGAEARDIPAGGADGHHLDGAARQAEGERPERVAPRPADQRIKRHDHRMTLELGWDGEAGLKHLVGWSWAIEDEGRLIVRIAEGQVLALVWGNGHRGLPPWSNHAYS